MRPDQIFDTKSKSDILVFSQGITTLLKSLFYILFYEIELFLKSKGMKIFQTVKIKITARLSHPPLFGIIKIVTSF